MGHYLTTEEFISRAVEVHGTNKYSYDNIEYTSYHTKVSVTCNKHSKDFLITPANLVAGKGCPLCGRENTINGITKTFEQFVEEAKLVHGDKYLYEKTKYTSRRNKVGIVCPLHGEFKQLPGNHLKGHGCVSCGAYNNGIAFSTVAASEFETKARSIHTHDLYDYRYVDYKLARVKVKILCKLHGVFEQTPNTHLCGCGCPFCSNGGGFHRKEKAVLYVFKIQANNSLNEFCGYGITNNFAVRKRQHLKHLTGGGFEIKDVFTLDGEGEQVLNLENVLKLHFKPSILSTNVVGFKRESTDASFESVIEFTKERWRENGSP